MGNADPVLTALGADLAQKNNSPVNLTVLRKLSLGLLRAADAVSKRADLRRKIRMACLNTDFLRKAI